MTERHLFHDHTTLVVRGLRGTVSQHPNLSLIPSLKVVFDAAHDRKKVSTISGGGSGHEPFSSGFVGKGFLTGSASGDVFASPSARQVYGAIKSVPSDEGIILIITNYTGRRGNAVTWRNTIKRANGKLFTSTLSTSCRVSSFRDNLHFGLACQQARADGLNVEMVPVGDDVSVGREKGGLVGRRALAGVMLVSKLVGAASEVNWNFERCLALTRAAADNLVSCATLLDHANVPGRSGEFGKIPDDTVEIGLGLHNEPGFFVVSPQPGPEDYIRQLLKLLLDQNDKDRAYVQFDKSDTSVLLLNNQGGMSTMEMNAAVDETLRQLEEEWNVVPSRVLQGTFVTTFNAPGFSISLMNITKVASTVSSSDEELIQFLDASHGALAWPGANPWVHADPELAKRTLKEKLVDAPPTDIQLATDGPSVALKADAKTIAAGLRAAAIAARDAEPDLTRWDSIVGDGDCGETVKLGAEAVLKAVDEGFCSHGDVIKTLRDLTTIIDDSCGGTLGAILSIYLASLTTEARTGAQKKGEKLDDFPWGEVCTNALNTLQRSTSARKGMRTVMDAIIPLVEELSQSGSFESAVKECTKGAKATQDMKAKLGRATYVGEKKDLPPDPGAMAFSIALEGFLSGVNGQA